MNLAGKPPLGLKDRDDGRDPAHLDRVRGLPCAICEAWGIAQRTPTEAHHCIHGRYGQRRTPDRMAIPLCKTHHDELHAGKETWRKRYGPDTDWVAGTLDRLERNA